MHINEVVAYVRDHLTANQLVDIEISDEQIINIIQKPILALFDQHVPCVKMYATGEDQLLVNLQGTGYQITIPDEVVSVLQVLPDIAWGDITYGIPVIVDTPSVVNTYANAVDQFNSNALTINVAWQFIRPNIVNIYTMVGQRYTVIYLARHALDFSTISEAFRWTVFKAAYAATKRALGTARRKYSTFNTPFGQIEVDWQLRDEGVQELQQIEEELKSVPPLLPLIVM